MRVVSSAWIDNQNSRVRSESNVWVEFSDVYTPSLSVSSSLGHDTNLGDLSKITSIKTSYKKGKPLLELNYTELDGDFNYVDKQDGYVSSELSDEGGEFSSEISVEVSRGTVLNNASAITIEFDRYRNEFAVDFDIIITDGDNVSTTHEIKNNRKDVYLFYLVGGFIPSIKKVKIVIKSWCLPKHRARVTSLLIGTHVSFNKGDIVSLSTHDEVCPVNSQLPIKEVNVNFSNFNHEFSPSVQDSYYYLLYNGLRFSVYAGYLIDGDWERVLLGKYAVTNIRVFDSSTEMQLSGVSVGAYLLDKVNIHNSNEAKGFSGSSTETQSYLTSILDKTGASKSITLGTPAILDKKFRTFGSTAKQTYAETAQEVAVSTLSTFYHDRNGGVVVKFAPFMEQDYTLYAQNMYKYPDIVETERSNLVKVNSYMLTRDNNVSTRRVSVPLIADKEYLITSDEPLDVNAIKSYFTANQSKIQILPNGITSFFVKFKTRYTSEGESIDIELFNAQDITEGKDYEILGARGDEISIDSRFISDTTNSSFAEFAKSHTQIISEWLSNWQRNQKVYTLDMRVDPALEVLDVVSVENRLLGAVDRGVITGITMRYDGAFKGAITVRCGDYLDFEQGDINSGRIILSRSLFSYVGDNWFDNIPAESTEDYWAEHWIMDTSVKVTVDGVSTTYSMQEISSVDIPFGASVQITAGAVFKSEDNTLWASQNSLIFRGALVIAENVYVIDEFSASTAGRYNIVMPILKWSM